MVPSFSSQGKEVESENDDSRGLSVILASSISFFFCCIAIILRIVARQKRKVKLAADDWWIFGALFLCACDLVSTIVSVESGLGRHVWTIANAHALAAGLVTSEIVYAAAVVPIKISMLYLYQRVFPSRKLFYISLSLGGFIILYSTAQIIAMALQCLPLSSLWTNEPAQCINIGTMTTVMGSLNIFTDIVIIVLPIPHLWSLKLSMATRLGLLFTFALGSITVVFSILRTVFVGSSSVQDASWNDVPAAMYSSLEMNIGVISACLPTLRPLFFPQKETSRSTATKSKTTDGGFELFSRPRSTVVMSRGGWDVMQNESELGIHKQTTFTVEVEDEKLEDLGVIQ